jgi:hypothetical protein
MLVYVPLNAILDNPFQTRKEYTEIELLAADIAARRETYPDTLGNWLNYRPRWMKRLPMWHG